ncbi:MAG: LamG-like jellyroll fold domain-containing protein [Opitutaceae bacterium]|jgi:hypothetical protein
MNSFLCFRWIAVFAVIFTCAFADEPLDKYLVARWTFNGGSLKSDVGNYKLRQMDWGSAPSLDFDKDAARIGRGTLLICDDINSKALPKLTSTVTIWIRVLFETPIVNDSFFYGFRDEPEPGNWKNLVFCGLGQPGQPDHSSLFCRFASKAQFGRSSTLPEMKPGLFHNVAMVFDGNANSITYYVDSQELIGKHKEAASLDAFTNFAIGRLSASAASPEMVVDEIRIYGTALNSKWIGEIDPVVSKK